MDVANANYALPIKGEVWSKIALCSRFSFPGLLLSICPHAPGAWAWVRMEGRSVGELRSTEAVPGAERGSAYCGWSVGSALPQRICKMKMLWGHVYSTVWTHISRPKGGGTPPESAPGVGGGEGVKKLGDTGMIMVPPSVTCKHSVCPGQETLALVSWRQTRRLHLMSPICGGQLYNESLIKCSVGINKSSFAFIASVIWALWWATIECYSRERFWHEDTKAKWQSFHAYIA